MFANYSSDETELLSLMLNKEEFVRYINQQFEDNDCHTKLKPLIWAIHLNISKHQRLPLLEKIFHQNMQYIKTCYSFLPEKQIFGKTYEALGIPTSCGEPKKCFLNAYKKYKSYYPVKFPEKSPTIYNEYDSIKNKSWPIYNFCNSSSFTNTTIIDHGIFCSTPLTKHKTYIEINPIVSPIRTPTFGLFSNLDVGYLNMSNYIEQNNTLNESEERELLSKTLEISGLNGTEYLTNVNSQCIQIENDISQSIIGNKSDSCSEESQEKVVKDKNVILLNYENSNKKYHTELKLDNSLIQNRELKHTVVLKQSLNKNKYHNNNNNLWIQKKKQQSLVNNITSRLKQIKHKVKKLNSKSSIRRLYIKQTFSDISTSELHKTDQMPITIENSECIKLFNNKIEQDSIILEHNNTLELQNMNDLSMDKENYRSRENTIISVNSVPLVTNLSDQNRNTVYNISNTSDMSASEFIKWSHDGYCANDCEQNSINDKKVTTVFNNVQCNENIHSKSKENISVSFSKEFDILSLPSTSPINNLMYTSNNKATAVFNNAEFNKNMYSKPKENINKSFPTDFDISLSSISSIDNQSILDITNNSEKQ